ncbi:MAG: precorrin-6y C5,15-methyltransferase (decarboxylating) subunit CbiE [Rhodospirillaceae bacterium]|nr:precorrin-6y C5,15-methyltransferase (decarboxylating) subunit CbiE [Rhodospirillaceae bacterium]
MQRQSPVPEAAPTAWLAILGIGEDGVEGLSERARELIAGASLVVGGRRHLALAAELIAGETLVWGSPIAGTIDAVAARRGEPVVVLASGDPFWFGVGSMVAARVPAPERLVLPQLSSISFAAAHLGWPLQEVEVVSLCGRPLETLRPHLADGVRLFVLSADETTPAAVAAYLCTLGVGPTRMHLLEALGGPHQRCRSVEAAGFDLTEVQPLNLVALEVAAGATAQPLGALAGRPDALFDHDGQITKAEVRAITLASLAPAPGQCLWDIGCGSGAIAIEWLLAAPRTRAVAVDRRADRLERALANARALGVPHLEGRLGAAPVVYAGLPPPDAVFLGGGASDPAVLQAAWVALPPGGRLVGNAVTLETQQVFFEAHRKIGGRLMRIAIERVEPVGRLHGFRPAMPVLHFAAVKPRDAAP